VIEPKGDINVKINPRFLKASEYHEKELKTGAGFNIILNGDLIGLYFKNRQILFLVDSISDDLFAFNVILSRLPLKRRKWIFELDSVAFKLGADPEFEELLQENGYEPIYTNRTGLEIEDEIGCDGAGAQLELRPKPANTPKELVKNIKQLIELIPPVSVKGDKYPIGGHIHIGLPFKFEYIELLDDFLGRRFLNLSGMARAGYKKLGSYELKPWGFEYRSLPSACYTTPELLRLF